MRAPLQTPHYDDEGLVDLQQKSSAGIEEVSTNRAVKYKALPGKSSLVLPGWKCLSWKRPNGLASLWTTRSSASHLQRALARHLWLAVNPTREPGDLPAGWPNGQFMGTTTIDCADSADGVCISIDTFFWSKPDEFLSWPDRNSQRENPHLSATRSNPIC